MDKLGIVADNQPYYICHGVVTQEYRRSTDIFGSITPVSSAAESQHATEHHFFSVPRLFLLLQIISASAGCSP